MKKITVILIMLLIGVSLAYAHPRYQRLHYRARLNHAPAYCGWVNPCAGSWGFWHKNLQGRLHQQCPMLRDHDRDGIPNGRDSDFKRGFVDANKDGICDHQPMAAPQKR